MTWADFQSTTEIVRAAQAKLAPPVWEYVTGGAETETTMLRNREAIAAQAFRARVLRNVAALELSTDLLGTRLRLPYIFAPVGGLQLIVPEGSAAAVRAATTFGTLAVVSSSSEPSIEACAAASSSPKWYQLYVRGDLAWVADIVRRVEAAGYAALVITVDLAYYGNRERQVLRRWLPLSRRNPVGEEYQALLDWETLAKIKARTRLPLVLKGIQTGEDARIALEHGIEAIWVSNHGGRQLDHGRGTLDMLVEIRDAVGDGVPLVVDGGFLRGTDILKAVALGATAVASGRLYTLALAAGGEAGAVRILELMELELRKALGLLGAPSLAQLDSSYLTRIGIPPGDLAAFPLLPGTL